MHRACLIIIGLGWLSGSALAQESVPRLEIFFGYSFAHVPYLGQPSPNLNGWNTSLTTNVNRWFGLVADFGGASGSRVIQFPAGTYNGIQSPQGFADTTQKLNQIMFGPQLALRKSDRFTPYAHYLVGVSGISATWMYFGFSNSLDGTRMSFSPSPFTMAFGFGLDIKIDKFLAFRAIQADYVRTFRDGRGDIGFRLSAGLTVRLGGRRR